MPVSVPRHLSRAGVAAIVLTVALSAATADPAQALQPGEWTLETELLLDAPLPSQRAAVDEATGDVYVVDAYNNCFYKFDKQGAPIYKKGSPGSANAQFKDPKGIAVDAERNVYVVDMGNNRIQKFDRNGGYLGQWGGTGNGDGQFVNPYGIATDRSGHLYVTDSGNARVQKFDSDGNFQKWWGSMGIADSQFKTPMGVAINSDGNVLVADALNNRVQVFDENGGFLSKWGVLGTGSGQFRLPTDIAIDQSDRIYVADYNNKRVQKLNLVGTYLGQFTTPSEPRGLAFDKTTGRIYLASYTGTRAFRPAQIPIFSAGPKTSATVCKSYSSVLQASGIPAVSSYAVAQGALPAGLKLDGPKISGVPTKVGSYKVTLQADNTIDPTGLKVYTISISKASSKVAASFTTRHPKANRTSVYPKSESPRRKRPDWDATGRSGCTSARS